MQCYLNRQPIIRYMGIAVTSLMFMVIYGNINGFWYDEFAQIVYSAPPNSLLDTMQIADPTPPFFSVVANLWMRIVPMSESWLLLLPQLAVATAVVVMGLWCEKFYGFRGGILGASLLAFSQMIIEQCGFEFRGYGFYLLFATLVLYLHRCNGGKKHTVYYTVALICLAYCHIFGIGICLAMGLWDFLQICRKRESWKGFLPYLFAAVAVLPWGIYFLLESGKTAIAAKADWMIKPSLWDVVKLITFLCGNHIVMCILFAIGCLLAVLLGVNEWKTQGSMEKEMPLFVGAALIIAVFTYNLIRPEHASLWVKRYFVGLFPCATFLAVGGAVWLMERFKKQQSFFLPIILITTISVWGFRVIKNDAPFDIYYHREVAQVLQQDPAIGNPHTLVLSSLDAYADGWNQLYLKPHHIFAQVKAIKETQLQELFFHETVYVDTGYGELSEEIATYLTERYQLAQEWADISLQKYIKIQKGIKG